VGCKFILAKIAELGEPAFGGPTPQTRFFYGVLLWTSWQRERPLLSLWCDGIPSTPISPHPHFAFCRI